MPIVFASCLVTSTVEFQESAPSSPHAYTNTAVAASDRGLSVPVTRFLQLDRDSDELVTLSVDVQSFDGGRWLYAKIYVDYQSNPSGTHFSNIVGENAFPPSKFGESRTIHASFKAEKLRNGCSQIALVISHKFDGVEFLPVEVDDTALVVWWAMKGDSNLSSIKECFAHIDRQSVDPALQGQIDRLA